jgi:hypothetical protein
MHALAGLAIAAPPRTQTVLDVLCAYLRQPPPSRSTRTRCRLCPSPRAATLAATGSP